MRRRIYQKVDSISGNVYVKEMYAPVQVVVIKIIQPKLHFIIPIRALNKFYSFKEKRKSRSRTRGRRGGRGRRGRRGERRREGRVFRSVGRRRNRTACRSTRGYFASSRAVDPIVQRGSIACPWGLSKCFLVLVIFQKIYVNFISRTKWRTWTSHSC